ncbi:hypothetical protein M885DRAFT_624850 [Pelagophyceae sp. CCMP2097]|nr:hypothetical protein M885DRAFT_624850 [Pelagophyceae sp. CCMP2097]
MIGATSAPAPRPARAAPSSASTSGAARPPRLQTAHGAAAPAGAAAPPPPRAAARPRLQTAKAAPPKHVAAQAPLSPPSTKGMRWQRFREATGYRPGDPGAWPKNPDEATQMMHTLGEGYGRKKDAHGVNVGPVLPAEARMLEFEHNHKGHQMAPLGGALDFSDFYLPPQETNNDARLVVCDTTRAPLKNGTRSASDSLPPTTSA